MAVGQTVSEISEDIKRLRDGKPINEVAANRLQKNIQHHMDLNLIRKSEIEDDGVVDLQILTDHFSDILKTPIEGN